jgi:hypothetical protein
MLNVYPVLLNGLRKLEGLISNTIDHFELNFIVKEKNSYCSSNVGIPVPVAIA